MDHAAIVALVQRHIEKNLGFTEWELLNVSPREGSEDSYDVQITLRNSKEADQELVQQVPPEAQEVMRDLLTGDFPAIVKIIRGVVRDVELKNMTLD